MGSNSSSGGSGNNNSANNVPPSKRKYDVSGTLSDPREKDDTAAKMSLFREQGATNLKNTKFYTPTTAILAGVGQATSRYNRDYFANEVLGKGAYKETTKQDFEKMSRTSQESLYSGYMSGRQSGKTDAYGREINRDQGASGILQNLLMPLAPILESQEGITSIPSQSLNYAYTPFSNKVVIAPGTALGRGKVTI